MSRIDRADQDGGPDPRRRPPRPVWRWGRARCGSRTPGTRRCRRIDPKTSRVTIDPGPARADRDRGGVRVGVGHQRPGRERSPRSTRTRTRSRTWSRSGRARPGSPPAPGTCGSPTRATAPSPASTRDTQVQDSPITVGSGPVGIAVGDGAAWVANNLEGSLSRIDVEDLSVTARTLAEDGGAYGVAAHGGDVWVSNEHAGTLMRVTTDGELPAGRDGAAARRPARAGVRRGRPVVHQRRRRQRAAPRRRPHHGRDRASDRTTTRPSLDPPRLRRLVTGGWPR